MPVIRVSRKDLEKLVGRNLSKEEILDLLPRLKCEVETIDNDVIEYEATHDRPDMYSVEGLARGIRYLLSIKNREYRIVESKYKAYAENIHHRPYIAFAIVKDLELDEEAVRQIMQLQEKLVITYGRNRRKASIGVYDLDKFKMPVYYELRDPYKTRFTPLNEVEEMNLIEILEKTDKGREYGWIIKDWDKYPVIRDVNGKILSMPPIINSEDTKVTVETKNVLIDSTGTDPDTVVDLVTIMATNIVERSRGRKIYVVRTILPDKSVLKAPRKSRGIIRVDYSRINDLLGLNLSRDDMVNYLKRMGYDDIMVRKNVLIINIPPYRLDIHNWVDIAEDIAIAYGYENIGIKADELPLATHTGRVHPLEYLSRVFRKLLISYGFVEVTNYIMSNPAIQVEIFGRDDEMIIVSNPKMERYTGLRIWLTPGLLEVVSVNTGREKEIRIFEIGDVVIPDPESDTGARSERRIGIAISHDKATLTDGLAVINTLLKLYGFEPVFEKTYVKGLLPERTAEIKVKGGKIGFIGEVHPEVLLKLGIMNPVIVAEIVLNDLLNLIR